MIGDERLLEAMWARHARAVDGFLRHLVDDPARAQELSQEVFLRAWRHQEDLDDDEDRVRSYLFTIARNLVTDDHRAAARRPRLVHDEASLAIAAAPDEHERALQGWLVDDAIATLSPAHREVVDLMFFQGLSVAATADRLGVPAGTVKSRSYYAVRALRAAFQERGITG